MLSLASDFWSWSPLVHGAVTGGCLVALALVCLVQYGWHLYHVWEAKRRARQYEAEISELSSELGEVQKDRTLTRLENRILRGFVSESDIDKAVDLLLRHFAPDTAQEFGVLFRLQNGVLVAEHCRGLSDRSRRAIHVTADLVRQLVQDDVLILKDAELRRSSLWEGLAPEDRPKAREVILLSVGTGRDMVGVLMTTSLYPASATREQQIELARRLMVSVAGNFKRTRVLEQREHQLRTTSEMLELRSLSDRNYSSPLDMVQTYLAAVRSMIKADGAALFFPAYEERRRWKPMVQCETDLAFNLQPRWEAFEERVADAFDQAEEFQTFDAAEIKALGIETLMETALLIPLLQQHNVAGVFCFSRRQDRPFEPAQRQLAIWAAHHLGKSLMRLQTLADIQRQARQDGLTQLANRRTFDEQLERELRVAQRAGVECSLLLCDLDRFKAINDNHGHPAGDEVLRVTARILRKKASETPAGDRAMTARYGGEEMAIILPAQGLNVAAHLADEIRAAIQAETVLWKDPIKVTMSIGVAAFPQHGRTAQELINVADEALYLAKSSGRNRTCCAPRSPQSAWAH